jgi:putative heme-binding domain-containing protein
MEGSPLRREPVVSLLDAKDEDLGNAVLWVVGHHPEWSSDLVEYLRARLESGDGVPDSLESVRAALLSFSTDAGVQQMMAHLLAGPSTSPERKLFILDTIDGCSLDQLPSAWLTELRSLLHGTGAAIQQKVLTIIATRGIADMDDDLDRIAADTNESDDLRTAAIAALVAHRPGLAEPDFRFLLGLLRPETDSALRLSAAQALSKGGLNPEQRLVVVSQYLPKSDQLVLPILLDIFREDHDEEMGRKVVAALLQLPDAIGSVAGERLRALLKNFPSPVQAEAKPLLAHLDQEKERQAEKLKKLEPLLRAGGDVGRGRNIFFGKKAACSSCHTVGVDGGHVGPDLTAVGAVRSGLDILEAVVFPNASFVPGHEVYRVETAREVYTGVRGESTDDALIIVSGPRDRTRIPRKDIISMEPSAVSLMPDGFDQDLTRQELTDLLAFLQAQKSRQDAVAGGG